MVRLLQNDVVSPEAAELIASKAYDQVGLRRLAALLPEDDEELHQWLEGAGGAMDEGTFRMLFSAAALGGRTLQASLLMPAFSLRESAWNLGWVAWRMEGNVTHELLRALAMVAYGGNELRAVALFVAAAWWQKHRAGQTLPGQLMRTAEALSREKKLDVRTLVVLRSLSILLGKDQFALLCARTNMPMPPSAQQKELKRMFALLDGPYEKFLHERKPCEYSGTLPQRRAVERIGRNEKCPCESGKKYKHCCYRKDMERLRHSSAVAGVTRDELDDQTTPLTKAQLTSMGTAAVHLDPERVPEELQEQFIISLIVTNRHDEVIAAFRKLGVPKHLHNAWSHMFEYALNTWRPKIARQLLEVFPDAEEQLGEGAHAGIRLLFAGDDPAKFLETVEAELRAALTKTDDSYDSEELQRLIWTVTESPYRALGIFLLRSLLPIVEEKFVPGIFDGILEARARLNLSPDDEFSDWMDQQALRKSRKNETAAAQEAQDKLTAKIAELRATKEERARLERELALRNRHERRELEQPKASVAPDAQGVRERADLKAKIERLNALVTQRGEEKLALRRELEKADRERETLKAEASAHELKESGQGADDDDFKVDGSQPVRLLEFPKDFAETLAGFPRHVGRAVMNRLGRIASGEPGAFERVKQLKAYPEVLRARVADKHRLLFCLTPDRVRVVDLIRRADLDRRIERLQASGLPPIG